MKEIYLNTAGAGKMQPATLQTIKNYLEYEATVGGYTAADNSADTIAMFYTHAAELINTESQDKLAYTDSASRSWNIALHTAPLSQGATIITLESEFGTNLISIYNYAEKINARVELIPCEADGSFSIDELTSKIPQSNCLIALSHAAAQGSIINPVNEIGKIARETGTLYLVDGCQAVGNIPVNVEEIGCDAYTATGRKWLCGPRGTGFLYIDYTKFGTDHLDLGAAKLTFTQEGKISGVSLSPDARHYELWERSVANMLGLSSAINEQLTLTPKHINMTINGYANSIRKVISDNKKLQLIGKRDSISGISGFTVKDNQDEAKVTKTFTEANINLGIMDNSNCPAFLRNQLQGRLVFRLSPAYTLQPADITKTCEIIADL